MKKRIYIIAAISTFVFNVAYAQKGKINNAQKQYDKLSYIKSVDALLKIVESGNSSTEVLNNLANAYYFNGMMEEASNWYGELFSKNEDVEAENYFRYAQALKAQNKYKESDKAMQQFVSLKPEDSRAKAFINSSDYLNVIEKLSDDFKVENLSLNTKYSDFGTSFYKSGIYFASSRGEGKIYNWNEQPFLNIYSINASNVLEIKGDINTQYHESSTTFSKDGKTMYFTRNNYFNGKFKRNSKDEHSLKVYKASLIDGKWTNVTPLPFNNDEYNVAHPALNNDETKLYFASDMPGTIGGSDIFVVTINEDGTYGTPQNLGSKINTEGRENFPFVSNNGTLYFSSDAHVGLGGLDVFEFPNIDNISSSNDIPYNVGKPINSPKDDFGYIINEETRKGYFSSNREGGKGDDDIYSFTRNVCKQNVSGTVVDVDTNEIIANANLTIYDENNNVVETLISNANGAFSTDLVCKDMTYRVTASKTDYSSDEEQFKVHSKLREPVDLKLSLKAEPKAAEIGTDLFKLLNLNPIYFDYDKSNIRPDAEIELTKIINYMNEFPSVKVDVRSHTDSRGKDAYNLALSNRRNKSTVKYIVEKGGISKDRLTGKGYGETQLVNKCKNGVKCSKEEHQENRRSEFIVIAN
ncbi:OmpA family protein [Pontimicrobium sp. SW4]|uniref:OmpA family protein n=1 Tax=Pontimicrobium sp. SW4 TaxID=3153519 RepID=A0AAU7BUL8_9FLAO